MFQTAVLTILVIQLAFCGKCMTSMAELFRSIEKHEMKMTDWE